MELILSLCAGIALSAACGFRVFVPFLVTSIAAHSGHLHLAHQFEWIGSTPALVTFSLATALEITAYYVPWLDHFLDTIAAPASVVAGSVLTASMFSDMSPYLRWTLGIVAGGGSAGLVQAGTMLLRGTSLVTTGGLANPLVATVELGGSLFTSVLALIAPLLAILVVGGVVGFTGVKIARRRSLPPKIQSAA